MLMKYIICSGRDRDSYKHQSKNVIMLKYLFFVQLSKVPKTSEQISRI